MDTTWDSREIRRHIRGPKLAQLLGGLGLASIIGCSAGVKVAIKKAEVEAPKSNPRSMVQRDSQTSIQLVKNHYQTRQVIRFRVNASLLGDAPSLTVLNVTGLSPDREGEAPAIVRDQSVSQELQLAAPTIVPGLLVARDPEGIVFSILPKSSEEQGETARDFIRYGKNNLKIIAHGISEDRFANIEVTLKDFNVFGPLYTAFVDPIEGQQATQVGDGGYQFQGWLDTVSPPVVRVSQSDSPEQQGGELAVGLPQAVN